MPNKVLEVSDNTAIIEGGEKIRLDPKTKVKKGDYIRVLGDVMVDSMSQQDGEKIQSLLKELSEKQ